MTDSEIDCLERRANDSCECDSAAVLDLIEEVRRLKAEAAVRDEPRLVGVGADGTVTVEHWAVKALAASFADTLGSAPNWSSILVGPLPSSAGMLVVTVRRADGETPEGTVTGLKAELGAVVSAVRACYLALDHGTPNTLAVGQAFTGIEQALGMRWKPGEERERREKEGGGE